MLSNIRLASYWPKGQGEEGYGTTKTVANSVNRY